MVCPLLFGSKLARKMKNRRGHFTVKKTKARHPMLSENTEPKASNPAHWHSIPCLLSLCVPWHCPGGIWFHHWIELSSSLRNQHWFMRGGWGNNKETKYTGDCYRQLAKLAKLVFAVLIEMEDTDSLRVSLHGEGIYHSGEICQLGRSFVVYSGLLSIKLRLTDH